MLTPDIIASLKSTHGENLRKVAFDDLAFVVRPPSRVEYKRFSDKVQDEQKKRGAPEELARCCVVYPASEAMDTILEKRAGVLHLLSTHVLELAGISAETTVEKL